MSVWGRLPAQLQLVLGFDWGEQRVGVASGNAFTRTATPLCTVQAQGDARWRQLEQLVRSWQPDALIVGVPYHPDGAEHANTRRALRFARQLHGRLGLPVVGVDERYSSTEAHARGAADADAAAACIIVEQFWRSLP